MPHTPHSHDQNRSAINTAAAFILAILPVIHVVTKMPTTVAIATDAPETNRAIQRESNCRKPTNPVAPAVTTGPKYGTICKRPAATAHAPAFSKPINENAIQLSSVTSRLVMNSMSM